MSQVAQALTDALSAVYDAHGESATYTDRDGGTTDCTVLLDFNLGNYGDAVELAAQTVVIAVRRSEVAEMPLKGETFTVGSTVYRVMTPVQSDELEFRVQAQ